MADYIMVPRKLVRTWLIVTFIMFTMILASFQYANYVDEQSNQRLCGLLVAYNETYKIAPPPSDTGKKIALIVGNLVKEFSCRK